MPHLSPCHLPSPRSSFCWPLDPPCTSAWQAGWPQLDSLRGRVNNVANERTNERTNSASRAHTCWPAATLTFCTFWLFERWVFEGTIEITQLVIRFHSRVVNKVTSAFWKNDKKKEAYLRGVLWATAAKCHLVFSTSLLEMSTISNINICTVTWLLKVANTEWRMTSKVLHCAKSHLTCQSFTFMFGEVSSLWCPKGSMWPPAGGRKQRAKQRAFSKGCYNNRWAEDKLS